MSNLSASNKGISGRSKNSIPKNYELWEYDSDSPHSVREVKFLSPDGRVVIKMKDIYRDLVPEDFLETS